MITLIELVTKWIYKLIDLKVAQMKNDVFTGAIDVPDKRDYLDGTPDLVALPREVDLYMKARAFYSKQVGEVLPLPTQSLNSCTAYAGGDTKIITNLLNRAQVISFNQETQWIHQEDEQGATRSSGCTLQGALKMLVKYPQGYPLKEYRRINGNIEHIKTRLAQGLPIYSGISWKVRPEGGNNYSDMKNTGIYKWYPTKLLGGHAVTIVGYSDETQMFKCIEPMRYYWGANPPGVFFVPYSEIFNMHSMYILKDQIDES